MHLSYTVKMSTHDDNELQQRTEIRRESSSDGPCVVFAQRSTYVRVVAAAAPVLTAVSGLSVVVAAADPPRWPGTSSERRYRVARS
ncbi:hypothetical protein ACI65C_002684 [Semiaphis heraclei]